MHRNIALSLAKIIHDNSANQIIKRNIQLNEMVESFRTVRCMYTHCDDVSFACGSFVHGDLTDSIVQDHGMYFVPMSSKRFETMTVNALGMMKLELGGCDYLSIKDASEIALWYVMENDNASDGIDRTTDAMLMRLMLGNNSKHAILTFVFDDLAPCELDSLRTQVLSYCDDAHSYGDAMSKGQDFLRKLMYSKESIYKDKTIRIVGIAFRLSSVQRMVESMSRDDDFVVAFGTWLMRDKNSLSFKRKIAKLIDVDPPGTTLLFNAV
jgi:hypothetical protein